MAEDFKKSFASFYAFAYAMLSCMYLLNLTALWKSIALRSSKSISSKISCSFFFCSSFRTLKAFYSGIKQLDKNLWSKINFTFWHQGCSPLACSPCYSLQRCHCLAIPRTIWSLSLVFRMQDAMGYCLMRFLDLILPCSWNCIRQAYEGLKVGHLRLRHERQCFELSL